MVHPASTLTVRLHPEAWKGPSDNLLMPVDAVGRAGGVSWQKTEIGHHPMLPEKRMEKLLLVTRRTEGADLSDVRSSHHGSVFAQPPGCGFGSTQRAKIRTHSPVPQERTPGRVPGQIHRSCHLAAIIQPRNSAVGSTEHVGRCVRDQVTHPALVPKERVNRRPAVWVFDGRVGAIVHVTGASDQPVFVHEERNAARASQRFEVTHLSVAPQDSARLCSITKKQE